MICTFLIFFVVILLPFNVNDGIDQYINSNMFGILLN